MEANPVFSNRNTQFWGYVRLISEKTGYSRQGIVVAPTEKIVVNALQEIDVNIQDHILADVLNYLTYRADTLNNFVKHHLMDAAEARNLFITYHDIYRENNCTCSLPYNKQKGDKRDFAYFTCITNIITEKFLRDYAESKDLDYGADVNFVHDPRNLTYLKDNQNEIHGTFSRRYDGAYPSTINPKAVWEIKEYYNTTTFGSRIADGVYETQLDGYEINELSHVVEGDIKHVYLIDAYNTWWNMGKSYLCRIIDMLHMGLVDEVIFGKEVVSRWPIVLQKLVDLRDVEV